jgi:flavin reductase (DIM6/NTAB) family NADH-FMN oxidoreductase RutF
MIRPVNAIARTTGSEQVPADKLIRGYRHDKDKFKTAGLTPMKSELVHSERIAECPVQMESRLVGQYEMMSDLPGETKGFTLAIELQIRKTYVQESLRLAGHENRVDSDAWRPMIMSFQHLYGLKGGPRDKSVLADVEEELYRMPEGE